MVTSRFDAYTATTRGLRFEDALALTGAHLGPHATRLRPGYHGFEHRMAFKGEDGLESASVLWGGQRHGDLVMLEVKGEQTPAVVDAIRAQVEHRCTRVDSCTDFDEPGAWDRILGEVLDIKAKYRLRGERRGDWDFPEDGRTQMLGATTSAARARFYEKGKEPPLRHLCQFDRVRLEVQVRPERDAREAYSRLNAAQVWGATPFTRDLAARVLQLHVQPAPLGTLTKGSERDSALRWMCDQYGAHLVSLKDDLGDWESVGLTLFEMVKEARGVRAARHARGKS